jgi:hypothetical protein
MVIMRTLCLITAYKAAVVEFAVLACCTAVQATDHQTLVLTATRYSGNLRTHYCCLCELRSVQHECMLDCITLFFVMIQLSLPAAIQHVTDSDQAQQND